MGKALKFVLFIVIFAIASGIADSEEKLYQCRSPYDCIALGCPCVKGICQCRRASVGGAACSKASLQKNEKVVGHQCNGDCKCMDTKAGTHAHLP
ncbi:unnamed protein product [Amaranthus hypochondriacus]